MTVIETPANWRDLKPNKWCKDIPAAGADDRAKLKASIRAEGFKPDDVYRIVLYREKDGTYSILDGRTRHEVCAELDDEAALKSPPQFYVWEPSDETDDPWVFAIRTNSDRRHLTKSQIAAIAVEDPRVERLKEEARQAQQAAGSHGTKGGRGNKTLSVSDTERVTEPAKHTAKRLADEVGTNEAAVEQCFNLKKNAPDLLERVKSGEMGTSTAKKVLALRKHAPDLAAAVERGAIAPNTAVTQAKAEGLWPVSEGKASQKPASDKKPTSSTGAPSTAPMPSGETDASKSDGEPKPKGYTYYKSAMYACQDERHSTIEGKKKLREGPAKKLALTRELLDAARELATYYDRSETKTLIEAWTHYWDLNLLNEVIEMLINRRLN